MYFLGPVRNELLHCYNCGNIDPTSSILQLCYIGRVSLLVEHAEEGDGGGGQRRPCAGKANVNARTRHCG